MAIEQDWKPLVLKKNTGPEKELVIKSDGSKNKQKGGPTAPWKLDNETSDFRVDKVTHNLKMEIQQARTAKKLSQADLGKLISESATVIKNYENGSAIPDSRVLVKLRKALGVPLKLEKIKKIKDGIKSDK